MPSKTPEKKATKAQPKTGGGGKANALQKALLPSEELAAVVGGPGAALSRERSLEAHRPHGGGPMPPISYARHRFPPVVIQHAVWLYVRFTLSFRDVEDLLAGRGPGVSCETVRRWVLKFGPATARRLRQRRPRPSPRWRPDEMAARIGGEQVCPWRAVDSEGEVPDVPVQRRRDEARRPGS